jgi:hypothetical protein
MTVYHPIPAPTLHLFLLTLQVKGKLSNVYSMGESVEDALKRYLARTTKMKDNAESIEFVQGDLANPHTQPHH